MSATFDPCFDTVLAAAKTGDGRAFEQLYRALNRRVAAFAKARNAADPTGVVNDVFLKVFSDLPNFSGGEPQFSAWVFRIARHQLIDEARKANRRPQEISSEGLSIHELANRDNVESEALSQLGAEGILRHFDSLTGEQRDAVLLRVVSDLTVEAVAEILGKRAGAVKALQRRAFRALAKEISGSAVPL
ncbi:MAG: RNA polymerase sigma factor (sigma-70 family) [Verrucomicrobiales bacterium]